MSVTRLEQETIINYNQAEDLASIYTYDPRMIRKLSQLAQKHKAVTLVSDGEGWVEYTFPKRWVRVQKPRSISEENRQVMAKRARENFGKQR